MPYKKCPSCNKNVGVRTKICKCGHNFNEKAEEFSDIIITGWRLFERTKGMPKIEPPPPLPKGKMSNEEIRDWIAYEGLGECIFGYIYPEKIKDKKLAKLWKNARESMKKVANYVYRK